MSAVRIFSEKIITNSFHTKKFINFTNKLTETAKIQKGFIKSNSYFCDNFDYGNSDRCKIITISDWEDIDSWNNWYNSKNRSNVYDEFNNIVDDESINRLFKKNIDEFFLL